MRARGCSRCHHFPIALSCPEYNVAMFPSCVILPLCTLAQAGAAVPDEQSVLVVWAILAIGLAVVLFLLELLIPSGLVLGTASMICLVVGIILLFRVNTTLGLIGAIISLLLVPVLFSIAVRIWPQTPIARLLSLKDPRGPSSGEQVNGSAARPPEPDPRVATGARGRALTDLRPVGTCLFDGRRVECLAEGGLIRAGDDVQVVSLDGMHVKVRGG